MSLHLGHLARPEEHRQNSPLLLRESLGWLTTALSPTMSLQPPAQPATSFLVTEGGPEGGSTLVPSSLACKR